MDKAAPREVNLSDGARIEVRKINFPNAATSKKVSEVFGLIDGGGEKSNGGPKQAVEIADAVLARCDPYAASELVAGFRRWAATDERRLALLSPLIDRCLSRSDNLVVWSGIALACETNNDKLAERSLRGHYLSLLIRPDPVNPQDVPRGIDVEVRRYFHAEPARVVARRRVEMLGLIQRYNIREAIPVLTAIRDDPAEWDNMTRQAARNALKALEALGDKR